MKKLLLPIAVTAAIILTLILIPIGSLFAADLQLKSPNRWLAYPPGCGLYYGGAFSGSAGGGSTDQISGTQVLAGDLGVVLGYTCPIGTGSFWFVENIASLSKVNGADQAAGLSLAGAASFEQRVAIGAPWSIVQQLTAAIPSLGGVSVPSVPVLPTGISAGPVNPYVFLGLNERDVSASLGLAVGRSWVVSGEVGFGTLTRLSNGMVIDGWVKYQPSSTRILIGPTGQNFRLGDFVGVGMAIKL